MAKSKLKTCKACGARIAKNAKACPRCGARNKKPVYLRVWFILFVLIIVIVAFGSIGGKDSKTESVKVGEVSGASSNTETVTAEVKTEYAVGDILQDGDMKIVYVSSGDYVSDNPFLQPQDGNKYIFLKFAFENTGKSDNAISFYSFECYADGYAAEQFYGGENDLSASLSAGRSTEGYLYFEVPVNAEKIEIEYTTNYFTSKKINFVFEGEKDSGYTLPVNSAATDGAYKVGDEIEGSGMIIRYLNCETYISSNQFIQPKNGYHFIQLTLEFENTSSSDKYISSLVGFNCYADGIACDQTYVTEDDLSATLSSGRKTKGVITFEVPDNAETVEVEYEDNIWTSNKIVFSVD